MSRPIFVVLVCCCLSQLFCRDVDARRYYRRGRGGGYGGAQTPYSAAQHGMADLIRSQAMYNQATSQAMVNYEKARGSYLANEQVWMQAYQTRKRELHAQHASEADDARGKAHRYQEYVTEHRADVPKLSDTQLNHASGQITWPRALQDSVYAEHRTHTEAFFALRAQNTASAIDSKKVHIDIHAMRDELRNRIHDLNTNDFLDARKFLIALDTEIDKTQG